MFLIFLTVLTISATTKPAIPTPAPTIPPASKDSAAKADCAALPIIGILSKIAEPTPPNNPVTPWIILLSVNLDIKVPSNVPLSGPAIIAGSTVFTAAATPVPPSIELRTFLRLDFTLSKNPPFLLSILSLTSIPLFILVFNKLHNSTLFSNDNEYICSLNDKYPVSLNSIFLLAKNFLISSFISLLNLVSITLPSE